MDVGSEESAGIKGVPCRSVVLSDVGRRRQENQDSYGYVHTEKGSLFLVADGMGGAQGGATASALAIEVIGRRAVNGSGELHPDSLVAAIRLANKAVHEYAKTSDKLSGMGTTLVALAVFSDKAVVAHVGDSRIYLLKNDKLVQLTRDHTLVQELMDAGTISAEQAENHPISHMLTRSIGPTPQVDVELQIYPLPLTEGDRFLLCCDGLTNHVEDIEIQRILEQKDDLKDAAEMFIELANQRGGTDNITVQIVEVCGFDDSDRSELSAGEVRFVKSSELKFDEEAIPDLADLGPAGVSAAAAEAESLETDPEVEEEEGASAVDSLLFGSNPTRDDEINRERRAEKKKRAAEAIHTALGTEEKDSGAKVNGSSKAAEQGEEDDEFAFLDQESVQSEDEERKFRYVQYFGLAVIVVAVIAVIITVVGRTGERRRLQTVGLEPQHRPVPIEAPAAQTPGASAGPDEQQPVEAASGSEQSPAKEPAQPQQTAAIDVPDTERPAAEPGETAGSKPEPAAPEVGAEQAAAWPTADIIPDQQGAEVEAELASGVGPEAEAAASRIEARKKIVKQKIEIRQQIGDANYRLALLTLPSQVDVVKRREKLQEELAAVTQELEHGGAAGAGDGGALWKMRMTSIEAGELVPVAREVAAEEKSIAGLLQMYEAAKMLADNAAAAAEAAPTDSDRLARREALAKELETNRENLAAELKELVAGKINSLQAEAEDPFRGYLDASSLLARKQAIERKLKVIESLEWGLSMERLEQQVRIEAEKKELEKKLWELGLKVSDEEEDKILKRIAAEKELEGELGLPATTPEQPAAPPSQS